MPQTSWNPNIVRVAALAALFCIMAAIAIGIVYPVPVSSTVLGPEWQCSRLALFFTICSPVISAQTASVGAAKAPVCARARIQARL